MSTKAGMLARCPVCGNEYELGENPQMFKAVLRYPRMSSMVNQYKAEAATLRRQRDEALKQIEAMMREHHTLKAQGGELLKACKAALPQLTMVAKQSKGSSPFGTVRQVEAIIAAVEKEGK